MKMRALILVLFCCGVVALAAQETVTLTTPSAKPTLANYRVNRMILQFDDTGTPAIDEGLIQVELVGVERTDAQICIYSSTTTPTATTLLTALNKANLSTAYAGNATTGSLKQRIFHRLVVMNEGPTVCNGASFAGSLTGSVP